jgi:hypothetical protein
VNNVLVLEEGISVNLETTSIVALQSTEAVRASSSISKSATSDLGIVA